MTISNPTQYQFEPELNYKLQADDLNLRKVQINYQDTKKQ
jgi:hypothetical protein